MPRSLSEIEIRNKENFIISKALSLFEETTYRTFKMEELAKKCKMSKGVLFNYFRSKDTLFLSMLESQFDAVFGQLDVAIQKHDEMTKEDFFEMMIHSFYGVLDINSSYVRLLSLRDTVLLERIGYDRMLLHKRKIHQIYMEFIQNALLKVEGLSYEMLKDVVFYQEMLLIGYANIIPKEGVERQVIEDDNLELFLHDYKAKIMKIFTLMAK